MCEIIVVYLGNVFSNDNDSGNSNDNDYDYDYENDNNLFYLMNFNKSQVLSETMV